jgi:hypothetical protein
MTATNDEEIRDWAPSSPDEVLAGTVVSATREAVVIRTAAGELVRVHIAGRRNA